MLAPEALCLLAVTELTASFKVTGVLTRQGKSALFRLNPKGRFGE